jgi:L-ascorbate metabolism protein UlaG (beta-lactamase superfamily)
MTLQWYGGACFKITAKSSSGDSTVITDPYSNKNGLKKPKLAADIITQSHEHDGHGDLKSVKGTTDTPDPFVIKGPGEYEFKGVFVYGVPAYHDSEGGKSRGANTMYVISAEGITIAHLGDLGEKELTTEQLEYIENSDILLVPVGGKYTVDGKEAAKLVSQIEPRIVIPMHYKIPGLKLDIDSADKFIKEMGNKAEELDKYRINKKDLPQEETKLIILKP